MIAAAMWRGMPGGGAAYPRPSVAGGSAFGAGGGAGATALGACMMSGLGLGLRLGLSRGRLDFKTMVRVGTKVGIRFPCRWRANLHEERQQERLALGAHAGELRADRGVHPHAGQHLSSVGGHPVSVLTKSRAAQDRCVGARTTTALAFDDATVTCVATLW